MSLLRRLGLGGSAPERPDAGLTAAVRDHFAHLPAERGELIAAFAGLLMRVAHADQDVSGAEDAALRRLVSEHAGLSQEETAALVTILTAQLERVAGIDYALLTRTLNDHASRDEKLHLIDCLYAIAAADDVASVVEDEEIRSVARALMISHRELIEIRRRYAERLEVIQDARRLQRS